MGPLVPGRCSGRAKVWRPANAEVTPGPRCVVASDEGGDPRPWEAEGAVRRDCLEHRGPLLERLLLVGVVCGILTLCLGFPAVPGAGLAVTTWWMARDDLERMAAGQVDPRG